MNGPFFRRMSAAIDPTLTSSFIGGLDRFSTENEPHIQMEVAMNEHAMLPGSTCTIPFSVPPDFDVIDYPELRFTLERTFQKTLDFVSYNHGDGADPTDVQSFGTNRVDQATIVPYLTGANSTENPFDLNPLALGWHTKLGAYGMFNYWRLVNARGEIIDECSTELQAAKFVEKEVARATEEELQIFDFKARTNICQDTTVQANIRPGEGLMGAYYFSSFREDGDNIIFTTEMTVPLPFFMGKNYLSSFLGPCELQVSMNGEFDRAFTADMRFYSGFMETAVDGAFFNGNQNPSPSHEKHMITGVWASTTNYITPGTTPGADALSYEIPSNMDATGFVVFMCRGLKLTTRDLEAIIGNESCQGTVSDYAGVYRDCQFACPFFSNGFDVFTKLSKLVVKSEEVGPNYGHVLRDQYIRHHVNGSNIAAVLKSNPNSCTFDVSVPPLHYSESSISDDDCVYIIFKTAIQFYCWMYGPVPGVVSFYQDDTLHDYAPVTSGVEVSELTVMDTTGEDPVAGPTVCGWFPQQSNIGFSYIVVSNPPTGFVMPEVDEPRADVAPTPGGSFDAAGNLIYSEQLFTQNIVYPSNVTIENVRLGYVARKLSGGVKQILTEQFKGEGIKLKRVAPIFASLNQTTKGSQQFKFSSFQGMIGFLQFELYRMERTKVLGSERMLPCLPFEKYQLQWGSYTVQSSMPDIQPESYGNRLPMTISDWANDNTVLVMTTGSAGESDIYENIKTSWSNCFSTPKSVNLAALHRLRTTGVYYAMNAMGGMTPMRAREDWTFTYNAAFDHWFNSVDLGQSYLYSVEKTLIPNAAPVQVNNQCIYGMNNVTGPTNTYTWGESLGYFNLTNFNTTASFYSSHPSTPTLLVCTIWCEREYVLQNSRFSGITAAIVTTNS